MLNHGRESCNYLLSFLVLLLVFFPPPNDAERIFLKFLILFLRRLLLFKVSRKCCERCAAFIFLRKLALSAALNLNERDSPN